VEILECLASRAGDAIECGPGTVLAGLAKRTVKSWTVKTTSDAAGIARLLASVPAE
jgi:malonyl CoA-acyl carrier protein transacylase